MLSPFHASKLGWGWLRCRLSIHKGITTLNQRSPARRSATRKGKLLCLAVGVIISLMVLPYTFQPFILLRVTPAANRNSYRVAMLVGQLPRVAAFARNPGLGKRNSYRVAAACGILVCIIPHVAAACGLPVYSCFCTGDSRTFFTAKGGLFVFAAFLPADRQARMGMAANGRERALDDIADSHKRKGRSPEKPQIFLYLYHADYTYNNRQRHFFLAI